MILIQLDMLFFDKNDVVVDDVYMEDGETVNSILDSAGKKITSARLYIDNNGQRINIANFAKKGKDWTLKKPLISSS